MLFSRSDPILLRNEKDVDFSRWYKYQQSKMQKNLRFFCRRGIFLFDKSLLMGDPIVFYSIAQGSVSALLMRFSIKHIISNSYSDFALFMKNSG